VLDGKRSCPRTTDGKLVLRILGNQITAAAVVLVALLLIFGSQFSLLAMWFDMESNKDLGGRGRTYR
jgi:hypothetical protein